MGVKTAPTHLESGDEGMLISVSMLDEPNKLGEGKKKGWQSMIIKAIPLCLFVAMAVVSGYTNPG